ncbi:THAP domain-containing protein 1-like [Harpegnathos saltator]|uniref:THAP domain-containing protein 1-like n=1 Tax=Harpegnathos saltator TaxID=610380 RepID=UPI000948EC8E|nr:THAP domain-containing protein 1-like [Harpegnathos saltator]
MPSSCYIPKCKNTTKGGFHLFRFPLNRPNILKMWINSIVENFKPTKNHLICNAHFIATDLMKRPNASGLYLKNLAVLSIFFKASAWVIPPVPICINVNIPVIEPCIISSTKFGTTFTSIFSDEHTKLRKIMNSSLLRLKKQEMKPEEKPILRMIKSSKQKLMKRGKKIDFLEKLKYLWHSKSRIQET